MKNFNLSSYLKNIFSSKNKKQSTSEQIETKLVEKNKGIKEPEVITEELLQKDRKDTENTIIEKKLDNVRGNSEALLIEGRLDKSKSTIVKHRHDAASGDINKLEEKRLKGERMEKEEPELASKIDKAREFYKTKSPDGLKLAKTIKIAQLVEQEFDIDLLDDIGGLEFGKPTKPERELSPSALDELSKFKLEKPPKKEMEKISEDLINDPDFLYEIFSEEILEENMSTGTPIEERRVTFDLRSDDGDPMSVFKKGKQLDMDNVKKALMNYLDLLHADEVIDRESIHFDFNKYTLTGEATYIVPLMK